MSADMWNNNDEILKADFSGKLILYLGADWWGSDARALAQALRRQGNCLIEVQYEDYLPVQWSGILLKVLRRLIKPWCITSYNRAVRRHLDNPAIDFLIVFKGNGLNPATLKAFRKEGLACYCFYPDVGFAPHGQNVVECLPYYNAVFTTKDFHLQEETLRAHFKDARLVQHGFDPEVHRPVRLSERVRRSYGCDVSFVGNWSRKKELLVATLLEAQPTCHVILWGLGWERSAKQVQQCWARRGAFGDESAIIYQCSKINLGLLSEAQIDTKSGDQTTVRTWQIPAAGGFLLHEATTELEKYYVAGREVATFTDAADMSKQVAYYLANPDVRNQLAAAGQQRCKAAQYTYDAAATTICAYHENRTVR